MNKLEQLRKMTVVVADTGEIEEMKKFKPTDATTNPSLIKKASADKQYEDLIKEAVAFAKKKGGSESEQRILLLEKLFVNFGVEILKIVPGRVSTEVPAIYSFDINKSIETARTLIKYYEEAGVPRERILIKLASTWEGTMACKALEKEGIHCNMTLLFSQAQAVQCAEVGATLISPFVGRIMDWYKKSQGVEGFSPEQDPGVKSVTEIFNYFKKFEYKTEVMGASFRNKEEILELAGCDLLTISPGLLQELEDATGDLTQKLKASEAKSMDLQKIPMDEATFRWMLNEDAMATEKLAEGIRNFHADAVKLEDHIMATYF